ncbi:Rv3654c family TadE-like protein [Aeromicrobium sp.]
MNRRCFGDRQERGSVTVYAMAAGAFLSLLALVVFQGATLLRLQHEVSKAADLAALAATQASVAGRDGCRAAEDLARRNNAAVVRCRMDFDVATVTTRGESRTVWGQRFAFERVARAAPSDYLGALRFAAAKYRIRAEETGMNPISNRRCSR